MSDEPKRCELEETDSYNAARVGWNAELETFTVHVHECSECGLECEQVNGTYERCPHCGAVNELDEDYREVITDGEKYKLSPDDGVERSDDGVDSREELEADIREWIDIATYKAFTPERMLEVMLHWLDRQKRITIREHQEGCKYKAKADELQELVDSLTAEVEAQRKRANDAERGVLSEEWYVSRDRYEDDIAELKAERDKMETEYEEREERIVGAWQGAMTKREDQLAESRQRNAELTAERDNWANCYDMAVKREQNLLSKIDELTAERNELGDELKLDGIALDSLCRQRDELQAERDKLNTRCNALETEKADLREKVARQRRQLGELQDAIRARNQGELKRQWQRQVDDLTAERDGLREKVARLRKRVVVLVCDLAHKQKVCDVQRDSFLKLEVENAELRKELGK